MFDGGVRLSRLEADQSVYSWGKNDVISCKEWETFPSTSERLDTSPVLRSISAKFVCKVAISLFFESLEKGM